MEQESGGPEMMQQLSDFVAVREEAKRRMVALEKVATSLASAT